MPESPYYIEKGFPVKSPVKTSPKVMIYVEAVMKKLILAALFISLCLVSVSCGSREVREDYYDPSSYGQDRLYHPWNDPLNRNLGQ